MADAAGSSNSLPCWVVLDETGKARRVYLEKPADEAKACAWIYREDVPGEHSGLLMPRDGIEAKAAGYHMLECRVVWPTPEPCPAPELVRLLEDRDRKLLRALQFCLDLADEEYPAQLNNPGAEIVLRHIARKCREALADFHGESP